MIETEQPFDAEKFAEKMKASDEKIRQEKEWADELIAEIDDPGNKVRAHRKPRTMKPHKLLWRPQKTLKP